MGLGGRGAVREGGTKHGRIEREDSSAEEKGAGGSSSVGLYFVRQAVGGGEPAFDVCQSVRAAAEAQRERPRPNRLRRLRPPFKRQIWGIGREEEEGEGAGFLSLSFRSLRLGLRECVCVLPVPAWGREGGPPRNDGVGEPDENKGVPLLRVYGRSTVAVPEIVRHVTWQRGAGKSSSKESKKRGLFATAAVRLPTVSRGYAVTSHRSHRKKFMHRLE